MMGGALLANPMMLGLMPLPMPAVLCCGIGGAGSFLLNETVDNQGFHSPVDALTPANLVPAAINGMAGGMAFQLLVARG